MTTMQSSRFPGLIVILDGSKFVVSGEIVE